MKLKASLLFKYIATHSPIYLLQLKHSIFWVALLLLVLRHLSFRWQAFMMCCINKATPIYFIDSKCHIKQLKAGKSHKTCLTNHTYHTISYHWLLMPLGWTHRQTDRQTDRQIDKYTHTYRCTHQSNFKKPGLHRPAACARLV